MTALAPDADDTAAILWLTDHVDPAVLAALVVICLQQNQAERNARMVLLTTGWSHDDPDAWAQFSAWTEHRAAL